MMSMKEPTGMSQKTKRYRGDNINMIDAVCLDVPEELQNIKLSHNNRRDPFEQGKNQPSHGAIDVVEGSRVERNAWFALGRFHRRQNVYY